MYNIVSIVMRLLHVYLDRSSMAGGTIVHMFYCTYVRTYVVRSHTCSIRDTSCETFCTLIVNTVDNVITGTQIRLIRFCCS